MSVSALIEARYGAAADFTPPALSARAEAVLETVLSHRTVRQYRDEPLPAGTLELLVAAAQSASTTSNLQAWSVVAVEEPARRARLAALAGGQEHVASAPLVLMWVADLARLRAIAHANGKSGEGLDYVESFLIASLDAALAAQNAAVALEGLGLGCCYIGGMRNHPEAVAAELALPPDTFVVFGMSIGIPAENLTTEMKPRLPQQAVLHREQYNTAGMPRALDAYDERLTEFQLRQKMTPIGWTRQMANRIGERASLKGRDRLKGVLHSFGFRLG